MVALDDGWNLRVHEVQLILDELILVSIQAGPLPHQSELGQLALFIFELAQFQQVKDVYRRKVLATLGVSGWLNCETVVGDFVDFFYVRRELFNSDSLCSRDILLLVLRQLDMIFGLYGLAAASGVTPDQRVVWAQLL